MPSWTETGGGAGGGGDSGASSGVGARAGVGGCGGVCGHALPKEGWQEASAAERGDA